MNPAFPVGFDRLPAFAVVCHFRKDSIGYRQVGKSILIQAEYVFSVKEEAAVVIPRGIRFRL